MITLILLGFVAGVLTIAAPCVLPLLPVVVGGTIARTSTDATVAERQWYRPIVIASGLAASVIVFTLALKASTALLGVPQAVWQAISGGIVILFGITLLFPGLWERAMLVTGLQIACRNRARSFLAVRWRRRRPAARGRARSRLRELQPDLRPDRRDGSACLVRGGPRGDHRLCRRPRVGIVARRLPRDRRSRGASAGSRALTAGSVGCSAS